MNINRYIVAILILQLSVGCGSSKYNNNAIIIGHRGASGYDTENTLTAVQKAIDLRADAIEVDVWRTADDSLVVFHDKNTKRLAGDSLVITQATYGQLRELNLPDNQKIPTLREVLVMLPRETKVFIEFKNCWEIGRAGNNFPELGDVLRETGTLKQAFIISFNIEKLKHARSYLPGVPIYWLVNHKESAEDIVRKAISAKVSGININYKLVSNELMRLAKENKLEVFVWTVNKKVLAQRLVYKHRVDGLTTDFPDQIKCAVMRY